MAMKELSESKHQFEIIGKNKIVLIRINEGREFKFTSVTNTDILRSVSVRETTDELGEVVYVVDSKSSEKYYTGVAYSLKNAERMAHDYLRKVTEKLRDEYYPNHTLIDRLGLKN